MRPDPFATSAGAYVLGALSPEERHAFEQHLHGCAECRSEVHRLAGLPGLLSRVALRDVLADEPPAPPDTLLPGLLKRVRRARRVQRTVLISGSLALAACVLAVLAVLLVVPGRGSGGSGPPSPTVRAAAFAMTKVRPGPVDATARVSDTPGGSQIDLNCVYHDAVPGGWTNEPAYTLTVRDRYGTTHRVATWRIADGETSLTSGLTVSSDDISMIQLRDAHGTVLLRLRWPPPSPSARHS